MPFHSFLFSFDGGNYLDNLFKIYRAIIDNFISVIKVLWECGWRFSNMKHPLLGCRNDFSYKLCSILTRFFLLSFDKNGTSSITEICSTLRIFWKRYEYFETLLSRHVKNHRALGNVILSHMTETTGIPPLRFLIQIVFRLKWQRTSYRRFKNFNKCIYWSDHESIITCHGQDIADSIYIHIEFLKQDEAFLEILYQNRFFLCLWRGSVMDTLAFSKIVLWDASSQ